MTAIQLTDAHLTADPELRFLDDGKAVARFSVAVNSRRRNPNGVWVDGETAFYPVTAWGQLAENVTESLTRGAHVVISGTIRARSWTPKDGPNEGVRQTRLEVTADTVGANLAWATATITKPARGTRAGGGDQSWGPDTAADGEAPF